ncbi:hypothetical protein [Rhizobium sp. CECT 9324]|uniref:hypothetical protein n=1 Tax=Rhizobium sp. CECT 9324 TaxID=2845820 RepID=UPI001E4E4E9B|nr:hypothetical protein [Rhizobium sp. CECT 9324]CAH0341903.1 hypothetical protein RHI9324_03611 [Rhizobium sp. CECT 9324]
MTLRDVLELVYFISGGPLLAIIAAIGLKQLNIAKSSAKMSAKRDAYRLAAERVDFYLGEVIPALNELDKKIKELELESIWKSTSFEINDNKISIKINSDPNLAKALLELGNGATVAFNKLEAFAVPFVSGLADCDVAYNSIGTTYMFSVERNLWILAICGESYYKSVSGLFCLWSLKKSSSDLLLQKEQLDNKIAKIGTGPLVKVLGS